MPRAERDLAYVAARFDALYTELTGLQWELIAACRNSGVCRQLSAELVTLLADS